MPFDALGFRFELAVDDAGLDDYLRRLFSALWAPVDAEHCVRVVATGGRYELDDRPMAGLGDLVSAVVGRVNQGVLAAPPELILIHGAAVRMGEDLFVFPARSESGKSTLAARLALAGHAYLTDEAVAIDPETLAVVPYPKPISLDPGSWSVLPALRPPVPAGLEAALDRQWQVAPGDLPGGVGEAGTVTRIVFPRFEAGAPADLAPLARANALAQLVTHAFTLHCHGVGGFSRLAEVVRGATCWSLTHGSVDDALRGLAALHDSPR